MTYKPKILAVTEGGTGVATLTNHGILLGQGTSNVVATAAGSSGQVLQSGGASANPAYSTATFPATATGTGTLLRADGTNWAATTSTYPNTNSVSTLLYASSANVMSELTTGNNGVLITSGAGVPSISSTLPTAVQGNITSTGTLGNQLNTSRTCFLVAQNGNVTNQTGDGTVYTIVFGTTVFDQGTNFSTSTFTAPVTGKYLFCVTVTATTLGAAFTDMVVNLVTTGRTHQFSSISPGKVFETASGSTTLLVTGSVVTTMTATNTATVTLTVSGSTKTIGVLGGVTTTSFSGYLLC